MQHGLQYIGEPAVPLHINCVQPDSDVCDELAFWPIEDASDPDVEIINAVRPAMATMPGAMLLAASSPYSRRGALWQAYRQYYGKPSP
jgi:hypothetical protein